MKVIIVFGTRPEAIKMAPVVKVLEKTQDVTVCVTAQHREMLDQVLAFFDITPDFRLQLKMIESKLNGISHISGIFISHAHFGHYMGLMELGLEVLNTHDIPVYVMP